MPMPTPGAAARPRKVEGMGGGNPCEKRRSEMPASVGYAPSSISGEGGGNSGASTLRRASRAAAASGPCAERCNSCPWRACNCINCRMLRVLDDRRGARKVLHADLRVVAAGHLHDILADAQVQPQRVGNGHVGGIRLECVHGADQAARSKERNGQWGRRSAFGQSTGALGGGVDLGKWAAEAGLDRGHDRTLHQRRVANQTAFTLCREKAGQTQVQCSAQRCPCPPAPTRRQDSKPDR